MAYEEASPAGGTNSLCVPRILRSFLYIFSVAVASLASAQTARLGTEFRVNNITLGYQQHADVAFNGAGGFIIVWESTDGALSGIAARRFDANGVRLGLEFQVNTYTTSWQGFPVIAADASNNFVVAWQSYRQDGSYYGVYAQRFGSTGNPAGSEFFVNSTTTYDQIGPAIAKDGSGNFVVVWEAPDGYFSKVDGQRYTNVGVPQSGEFEASGNYNSYKGYASVARRSTSEFVVVWESSSQDGSSYGIFGQRYKNTGMQDGQEFQVNTYTTGSQQTPSVAMDGSGNFVVVWAGPQAGAGFGITGQRFNSAGTKVGGEFAVNTHTANEQRRPSIAMDNAGNFVVVWQSSLQDGSAYGIFGQRFTPTAVKRGTEFRVNTYTTGNQTFPSVGVNPTNGNFVATWDSFNQDGSLTGVHAQRFSGADCPPLSTSGPTNQTVCTGATAFFTVVPTGLQTFSYQWRKNGVNLTETSRIQGTKTATLKVKLVTGADVGSYSCVVTDFCLPPVSTTSASATMTVTGNISPGPVTGLIVQKIFAGASLRFTWNNTTNANDYVLFSDTAPSGPFTTQVATATSGVTGITIPMPSTNRYYLVAGRNTLCGVGPQD